MNAVKGYKVFNPDWTCRGKQYSCPGVFQENVKLSVCGSGMHFCKKASDCFDYYCFDSNNHVAEVIARGDVIEEGNKCCTNNLEIVREIPWVEVLNVVNEGNDCTGLCNTGNWNTGNWNTGNWNTGNRNTGNWNTGNWNTGNRNTGDRNTGNRNTGDWNTGDRNTGDWNTGDRNTGDWNKSSFNTGCFNTTEEKIRLFNKPSPWTYEDWVNSDARRLLNGIQKHVVEWVYSADMTDEEKKEHPAHETTGGYLKVLDESECAVLWWMGLNDEKKQVIRDIPNFDAKIFKEITGIDAED